MKMIKVKTVCGKNSARTTLAHPLARLGDTVDYAIQIRKINNIPDGVKNVDVVRLFEQTADVTYLSGKPRLEFDYSELGIGRIITI